jgi:hypothetical protein
VYTPRKSSSRRFDAVDGPLSSHKSYRLQREHHLAVNFSNKTIAVHDVDVSANKRSRTSAARTAWSVPTFAGFPKTGRFRSTAPNSGTFSKVFFLHELGQTDDAGFRPFSFSLFSLTALASLMDHAALNAYHAVKYIGLRRLQHIY